MSSCIFILPVSYASFSHFIGVYVESSMFYMLFEKKKNLLQLVLLIFLKMLSHLGSSLKYCRTSNFLFPHSLTTCKVK